MNMTVFGQVTVDTNPTGQSVLVDGTTITAPMTFSWAANSSHTLSMTSPQGTGDTRNVFDNWSDGGLAAHTIIVPSSPITYTATLVTQYRLTVTASPSQGGTVALSPVSADGFYNAGTSIQLTGTANPGYQFANWSGGLVGTVDPQSATLRSPLSVTANFPALTNITVTTNPPSLAINVDGVTLTAPQSFSWLPGSTHLLNVTSPQNAGNIRTVFDHWGDAGAQSHTITVPQTPTTYTAVFVTQSSTTQLKFTTQPTNGTAGTPLAPIVVQVQDASGNVISSSSASVTLTSSPTGVSSVVAAVNGLGTFSNLIFGVAGSYTLSATSNGIISAVSNPFTIVGIAQAITFGALSNRTFGAAPFTVGATASSGLSVSFNSQTTPVCTVSGSTVTLVSAGTCTIQATQAGNANYAAAMPVNQNFQVTQGFQAITFGPLPNKALGGGPFTVSATSSSGLTVSFNSQTTPICTVSGSTVTLVAVGMCTIQATQAGNTNYAAATPVNQNFQVTQGSQTQFTISGQVTLSSSGLSGVAMTLSGSQSGLTNTDGSGNFVFNGLPAGGSYTITPSLAGYTFIPPSASINSLSSNQTLGFTAGVVVVGLPNCVGMFSALTTTSCSALSQNVFQGNLAVSIGAQTNYYGAMTLVSNVPFGDAAGMALYNAGGGGGASVSLDLYNTSFNGGVPQAKIKAVDDGNYSDHLTFWTKVPGGQGNAVTEKVRITSNGNVGIGTTSPTLGPLQMGSGARVSAGGVWTNASDRNVKENFVPVSTAAILQKIHLLPLMEWNYKNEDPAVLHIGPVAQDFYSIFGVGNSDTSISTIDPSGIALAGIQALDEKSQGRAVRLAELKKQLDFKTEELRALQEQLSRVESLVERITR